ncbi:MAG: restriction endonuclease [Streptomycetaceae bacterium]|nr:restriction endonuclease [Streptomycetaceae bacterium]
MSEYTVVYDPEGRLGVLPLDREPHMSLVKAVLAWPDTAELPPSDCEQIALQLTGHARAVASDVRRLCGELSTDSDMRILAKVVLGEADRRLSSPCRGTVRCVKQRARMVRALYERLDRLESDRPAASST